MTEFPPRQPAPETHGAPPPIAGQHSRPEKSRAGHRFLPVQCRTCKLTRIAGTMDRYPIILSYQNMTADQQKYRTPSRFPTVISPGDIALMHKVPQPLRFHYLHRMKKNRVDPDPGPAHPDNPHPFTGRQRRRGSADRSHCTCSALPHRSGLQSLWAEETQTRSPGSSHPAQCNASSSDPVT